MKADYTHIVLVLDESSSMLSYQKEMESLATDWLKGHRGLPGKISVDIFRFSDSVRGPETHASLDSVESVKIAPMGNTALLDAMQHAIDRVGTKLETTPEAERPARVLFVVLTDGEENSSLIANRASVKERIKRQRESYSWEFVFLGCEEAAVLLAEEVGIPSSSVLKYANTVRGRVETLSDMSAATRSYAGGQSVCCSFDAQVKMKHAKLASQGD